jgi:hypothetical protein
LLRYHLYRIMMSCDKTELCMMKTSILQQNGIPISVVELVQRLVARIPWPERRQAMADATKTLLEGKPRVAEAVFGWGRATVALGMHELQTGIVCVNDLSNRRKPKTEEKYPRLVVELRAITDADSQAQSHLRTDFSYTNMTATSVRSALLERGWPDETVPTVRTLSNILNRQNYKLRRVTKTQVQKKRNSPTRSSPM